MIDTIDIYIEGLHTSVIHIYQW